MLVVRGGGSFGHSFFNHYQLHQPPNIFSLVANDCHAVPSESYGPCQDSWRISDLVFAYMATRWHVPGCVGTRIGLAAAVISWSVVNILSGFASSIFSFVVFRFMLGICEGSNWPGASKTVAEWFPSEKRSLAVAIFDSESNVGGALAALMIPWIALAFGWRWSFVFSGMLGFLWLFVWLRVYHPLDRRPRVTQQEVAFIRAGHGYYSHLWSQRCRPMASFSQRSECVGYRTWPRVDRSYLVVLCFLVALVSE